MLWPRELPRLIAALPGWDDPAHCDDRVLIGNCCVAGRPALGRR